MRRALELRAAWLVAAVLVAWALWTVGLTPRAVTDGLPATGRLVRQLWPPDIHPDFLVFLIKPVWETVTLSLAGLALALGLALPLSLLGTRAFWAEGGGSFAENALYRASRSILDLLRAVPDLAWALLFVASVGLGPVPALLAIGVSYGGMLGKIFAELFESVDPGPARAIHGAGGGRLAVTVFGLWPLAGAQILSYTLYAWECCMRAAAVMGFVGGGGIGYQIDLSMKMFEFGQVTTLLLVLLLLIAAVDAASFAIRRLLERGHGSGPRVSAARAALAIGFLGLMASGLWANRQGLRDLFSPQSAAGTWALLAGSFPPDLGAALLRDLPGLVAETLAMSVAGTALGVAIAGLLCVPATRTLTFRTSSDSGSGSGSASAAWRSAYRISRIVLDGLRAIPEVLWALLCVVTVGLGPAAGALAIGLHGGGVLGKLYAEALEEADRRPLDALVALGGGRSALLLYGAIPAALPAIASYTLLRWDMNLRVAAILGLVGAGGLGQKVWETINLGFYDSLATLVLVLWALIGVCDRISAQLRARLVVRAV